MPKIIELLNSIPELLERRKVFFVIFDGLGNESFNLHGFKKLSRKTIFPSSTPTFFYSLHSLLPPEKHGFLEWFMRFKNNVVTIPPWQTIDGKNLEIGKDVKRKDVFPFKSLSEILHKKGFSSVYYTPYKNSIFTKLTSKKAEVINIRFLSEVFPLKDADFTFIYWDSIDNILHKRSKDESFYQEIKVLKQFVSTLRAKIPKNSILFVFGDHGLTKIEKHFLLPKINGNFPVGGERVAFYKDVEKNEVETEIRKRRIPAEILLLEEIYNSGKISKRCYENFGEIAVIAKRKAGFIYPFENKNKSHNLCAHGGNTKEEMLINLWLYEKK